MRRWLLMRAPCWRLSRRPRHSCRESKQPTGVCSTRVRTLICSSLRVRDASCSLKRNICLNSRWLEQ